VTPALILRKPQANIHSRHSPYRPSAVRTARRFNWANTELVAPTAPRVELAINHSGPEGTRSRRALCCQARWLAWRGRVATPPRSSSSECAASVCWPASPKTTQRSRAVSRPPHKNYSNWAGPRAAMCGLISAAVVATWRRRRDTRQSWLHLLPTSSSPSAT
jgi:hypothetical protein